VLWSNLRRTEQTTPDGSSWVWYVQGGRGSGKTRTGSESLAEIIITSIEAGDGDEQGDWAVVAPTFGDARDTCVEGPSGLRSALAGWTDGTWTKAWNRSQGQLRLANGATLFADGADDGALRVQGKNLRGAWADEVGLWRRWEQAWDESLAFAVRLDPGVVIATGTPKAGHGLVKRLLFGDPDLGIPPADHVTRMKMRDNLANLSAQVIARLEGRYQGSTLGRQELEGEYLEDVEGALWSAGLIQMHRLQSAGEMSRVVVAVDPPGGATEAGIVIAGLTLDCLCGVRGAHAYVLGDRSGKGSPDTWGQAAVDAFDDYEADRIVGEVNYGGDMVEKVVRSVRSGVPYRAVRATRGKAVRAEPIVALYEQGRVHHIGSFGDLESEQTTWTPESTWSPNRLDALVWALTELGLTTAAPARIRTAAGRVL
jgi:phage terminase large subunit-like protein